MPGVLVIQVRNPTQALHYSKEKIETLGTMSFYWLTQVRCTIAVETFDANLSKIAL